MSAGDPAVGQPITTILPASQLPSINEYSYCHTWSQEHYRSFDGKLFSFHGACTYTLITDCLDYSFHIYVENDLDCQDHRQNNTCYRSVAIDNGNPSDLIYLRPGGFAFYQDTELILPTKAGGLVLERIAHYTLATSGLGFSILYDGQEAITVYITSDSLNGNTCGLCGVFDQDPRNDFRTPSGTIIDDAYSFGLSWKVMDERDHEYCPDVPTVQLRCTLYSTFESDEAKEKALFAESECAQLRHGTFMACHPVVDPEPYIIACEQDVCACEMKALGENKTGNDCKCAAFTAYTQECSRRGFQVMWRSYDFCPFHCPVDKVYEQCGSACTQRDCSTAIADCETDETVGCIEGCHCPTGTYRSTSGDCVSANECFCSWQGTEYEPGEQISDGCNECDCVDGKWQCSQNDCGGLCQVSGHGHYHTFDSYDYDFAGTYTYTLVKDCWSLGSHYMVSIENAACGMEGASCVKAVVLEDGMNVVRLRRDHKVLINGHQEVTEFPTTVGNIFVNQPTQHQTAAVMSNGLIILFDGNNHVVVMADEQHLNSTCGLCGIYNNNQRDDFYTEAGDIESNPSSFANKWKLGSSYHDARDAPGTDPCDLYSQKALVAEQECNRLYTDDAFAVCRQYVDVEVFYESCRRDVCNCETGDTCKCEIFAMYATQCAQKGVIVNWRSDISGCGISCEGGLVYSPCHPMCQTTCSALSSNSICNETCIEGCGCPEGSVLAPSGVCVAPENCGCLDPDTGETHAPGERIEKGCGFCFCDSGVWTCEELDCSMEACQANEEYVHCVSPCIKTCTNMHEFEACSAATCYSGCVCSEEFVWNGTDCVLPTHCPCHHGGHSYLEGYTIQTDECHSCTCINSKWQCQEKKCLGVCTAWGESHYKTFDGRFFDFQGDCDYVLVTDSVSQPSRIPFFHIVIGNIPCGSSGVTCTKSITFTLGSGANQEKLHLIKGKPIPSSAGSFMMSVVGYYVHVHTNHGITLIWDQGTWLQVKLDPMYSGMVGGLCGNLNNLPSDDFLSPAGGLPETSPINFGDSWKVHSYCPRSVQTIHPCLSNPTRRAWAMRQCSVMKSDPFKSCHSEVDYQPYYSRCVFDTCGCDNGGDCECLCTAIASYAQECNAHGVPIHWRSNHLCPIQCDGCREYNPCIPVCDVCGHEGRWDENGKCPDTCVEGCSCPNGTFHHNGQCVDVCPKTPPPTTTSTPSVTPSLTPSHPPTTTSDYWSTLETTELETTSPAWDTTPKTSEPETTTPEHTTPETTTPETTTPETTSPETTSPAWDTTPKTTEPGTTSPETTSPETTVPETTTPETTTPETTTPETTSPETTMPKTTTPETTTPETTMPETTTPETTTPEITAPKTTAPETTSPETTTPKTTSPETTSPETTSPETTTPETTTPETTTPETTTPETTAPETTSPEATTPETTTPETTSPETTTSETTSPETTSPETTTPETTSPETTSPETTTPETTSPETTTPVQPTNMCSCHGYGDPHYTDFNGNDFDHQGNCTYILSQDTSHEPPLYIVLIHNIWCERFPGTTCPRELVIIYNNTTVKLLSEYSDDGSRMIDFNDTRYKAPFNFLPTFEVKSSGLYLIYQAPAIGLEVRFVPLDNKYFSVKVPEAYFLNNTEGLCGNCGKNDTTCEENGTCCEWVAPEERERCGCNKTATPCPPTEKISDWCSYIYDSVFEDCRSVVDPTPYFDRCIYDECYGDHLSCWTFADYATECANHGICREWRNDTFCPIDCEEPLEYRQCVCPTEEYPSCVRYDPDKDPCHTEPVSGCFCPVGTMPIDNSTCVPCPTPTPLYTTSTKQQTTSGATSGTTSNIPTSTPETGTPTHIPPTTLTLRSTGTPPTTTPATTPIPPTSTPPAPSTVSYPPTSSPGTTSLTPVTSPSPTITPGTTPQTSPTVTPMITTSAVVPTAGCYEDEICEWTPWCDDEEGGGKVSKFELEIIKDCKKLFDICENPREIECEMAAQPHLSSEDLSQDVTCDIDLGLVCLSSDTQPICLDYRIRLLCCRNETFGPDCPTTMEPPTTLTRTESTTITPTTITPTTVPCPIPALTTGLEVDGCTAGGEAAVGDTCTYNCTSGSLNGDAVVTCGSDGMLLPAIPTCIENIAQGACGRLVKKANLTQISDKNCSATISTVECAGKCTSTSGFSRIVDGKPVMEQACSCCQPSEVKEDFIELSCPDGSTEIIKMGVITKCNCRKVACASHLPAVV